MKKRIFLFQFTVLLFSWCTLFNSCKPKNCCCDLPAPTGLTASDITGETAMLDWPPVPGAVAYRVTVKDITANTTLPLLTTVPDSILLTGLEPGHEYTAIVQAICDADKACNVSPNAAAVCFRTLIIQDLVVMRDIGGTGMVNCDDSCGLTSDPVAGVIDLANAISSAANNERIIVKFKITSPQSRVNYFKLAFDKSCPKLMKGLLCPLEGDVSFNLNGNTALEFKEGGNLFLTLTPDSRGVINVAMPTGVTPIVKYDLCTGSVPWTGNCP